MRCPDCGQEMDLVDKSTFTGSEVRDYYCKPCKRSVVDHGGPALWQILSDAREEAESARAAEEKKTK